VRGLPLRKPATLVEGENNEKTIYLDPADPCRGSVPDGRSRDSEKGTEYLSTGDSEQDCCKEISKEARKEEQ
jgi:hypothetical protein